MDWQTDGWGMMGVSVDGEMHEWMDRWKDSGGLMDRWVDG